jgi:predicted nuclease of predicted toxin-antitoxin system
MRVLLDECLPRGLKGHLSGHDVVTVPEAGWAGAKNGELLRLARGNVDAFITIDKNVVYQQTLGGLPFVVVILVARTNRLSDLLPLVPGILTALGSSGSGQVVRVGG